MTTRPKTRTQVTPCTIGNVVARAACAALAIGAVVACASKGSVELSAQTPSDAVSTDEGATSTSGPATTSQPAPAPTPAQPAAYDGPSCPLTCAILRPRSRTLATEEVERLRGALASTMSGLRSCVYAQGSDGRYHRPPPVNLRFNDNNELLDVGVDPSGYEPNAEQCFMSVVRGGGAMPDVKLDGPATVRCSEHCDRANRRGKPGRNWKTAPR